MLPAFSLGLAGRLGDGRQYWSWIALEDATAVLLHALTCESMRGPANAVSPQPVTNREFTTTLGRVLRRPTFFAMPRFAVNLLFGEMGREAMLASCRAKPAKLLASGFQFCSPDLETALRRTLQH
jgi:NAD dependent epimerase/dehydratase family enzyme